MIRARQLYLLGWQITAALTNCLLVVSFWQIQWCVPVVAGACALFRARPLVAAFTASTVAFIAENKTVYSMLAAVDSSWWFSPYMYAPGLRGSMLDFGVASCCAVLGYWIGGRWLPRVRSESQTATRAGSLPHDSGFGAFVGIEVAVVAVSIFAGAFAWHSVTHREDKVHLSEMYQSLSQLSPTELLSVLTDSNGPSERRVGAAIALSGLGSNDVQADQRRSILNSLLSEEVSLSKRETLAVKLSLQSLAHAQKGELPIPAFYSSKNAQEMQFFGLLELTEIVQE